MLGQFSIHPEHIPLFIGLLDTLPKDKRVIGNFVLPTPVCPHCHRQTHRIKDLDMYACWNPHCVGHIE